MNYSDWQFSDNNRYNNPYNENGAGLTNQGASPESGTYISSPPPPPPPVPPPANPYLPYNSQSSPYGGAGSYTADSNPYGGASLYTGGSNISGGTGTFTGGSKLTAQRRPNLWLRSCLMFFVFVVLAGTGSAIYFFYRSGTIISSLQVPGAANNSSSPDGSDTTVISVGSHPLLNIDNDEGAIHVHVGQANNQITIKSIHKISTFDQGHPIPYSRSTDGKIVTINTTSMTDPGDLDVTVPAVTDVHLNTNAGDIEVIGISGQHVTMITNAGSVTFKGTIDPQGSYDFESNGGTVSVTVPASSSFHIDASTNGSSFSTAFPGIQPDDTGDIHADVGKPPRATMKFDLNGGTLVLRKS